MTEPLCRPLEEGIFLIDTGYHRPGFAASYLITAGGRGAFVETGPAPAVERLMGALAQQGLPPEAVDYVVVSHVHLDHAGGAGELMAHLPNARLVVHPKGARHLIEPTKLINGTRDVYGTEAFSRLHGRVVAAPAQRVVEAEDGMSITVGERTLLLLDTPGHARHHLCVWDEASGGMFTGDTFGISYREFDTRGQVFLFPATTPTQFDPGALHKSIDRIATFQPRQIFLTHFGAIPFNRGLADELHRQIDRLKAMTMGVRKSPPDERHSRLAEGIGRLFLSRLKRMECPMPSQQALELLAMDVELNAQGLICWLDNPASTASQGFRPLPRFMGP